MKWIAPSEKDTAASWRVEKIRFGFVFSEFVHDGHKPFAKRSAIRLLFANHSSSGTTLPIPPTGTG